MGLYREGAKSAKKAGKSRDPLFFGNFFALFAA
jgi:hypothetical protein